MCGGPGEAAFASGTLAIRDCAQCLFSRNQYSIQSPPSNDVHSSQHARDAPQLPRRAYHVLPPQGLGELQQQQPHGLHGHVSAPSGQLGRDPPGPEPAGTVDTGARPHAGAPSWMALRRHPASLRRTEGQRSHGGREMRARAEGAHANGEGGGPGAGEGKGGRIWSPPSLVEA